MKKKFFFSIVLGLMMSFQLTAQVKVGDNPTTINSSAIFEMESTSKGLLPPRMTTTQINAITSPATGLIVYNTTTNTLNFYNGTAWKNLDGSGSSTTPNAPTGAAAQSFCSGTSPTVASLVAVGTAIKWYNVATGGTVLATTQVLATGTYYATQTVGGMESTTRLMVAVTINAIPVAPTGTATQTYGTGSTVANLVATGAGIKWYTTATGGTALATTTVLTTATTYYASQTVNGCESSLRFSVVVTISGTAWTCGQPIIVNHVAGAVAPVTKTVTYGTVVTTIFGSNGASKCMITRNLGASKEADSATEATEAAAGWYWQFNQKQGYKHDGTTLTPSIGWKTQADLTTGDTVNWKAANDPCTIELGAGWHIPTGATDGGEWFYADYNAPWTGRASTYNSNLKIHASGSLNQVSGTLGNRGAAGYFWSMIPNNRPGGPTGPVSNASGYSLTVGANVCQMGSNNKSFGLSVRCIKTN